MENSGVLKKIAKNFTVLYVEDDDTLRDIVSKYLSRFFKNVTTAKNGEEGLSLYKDNRYDLVLTDIRMPKLNGLDMSVQIKELNENQNILIISAYSDIENFITSIKIGIDGYILKPIEYNQLNSTLYKIVDKIKKFKDNEEYKEKLEKQVYEKIQEAKKLQEEKIKNYQDTLYALVKMVEDRDTYTGGHSQRVANYSKMIAEAYGFDEKTCENIYQAGILHDIGKIAIPDSVLLKPNSLDDVEYELIQKHVKIGVEMLNKVPMFKDLVSYIEAHHERIDGSGYPNGLKGDQIPIESQILAISDTFDAMTTNRIYKRKMGPKEALIEIEMLKGKFFREDIVPFALKVLSKVEINDNINQLPITKLEEERFSYFYKDQITQSYNANYLELVLNQNKDHNKYKNIVLLTIHNLKNINHKYSWEEGSSYLKNISLHLHKIYNDSLIFRIYDDDFLIISSRKIDIKRDILDKFILRDDLFYTLKEFDIDNDNIFSLHDFELKRFGVKEKKVEA